MIEKKVVALSGVIFLTCSLLAGCTRQETGGTRAGTSEVREVTPGTRQVSAGTLTDLPSGHPVGYYMGQFEQMGYTVKGADYQPDRATFELAKGNKVEEVVLLHPEDQVNVTRVESKHLGTFAAGREEKNMETDRMKAELQKLPTGKKAEEYVSMLQKYGTVTEYKLHQDNAVVDLTSNRKRYKVKMDINPQTRAVSSINLEHGFLDMAG